MRLLVTLRMNNGEYISIVANAKNKEDARAQASKLSLRLLGNKELRIDKSCAIINCEEWTKDKRISYQKGNKQYTVSFILENVVQVVPIEASGIKGAYNNVKLKFGIQDEPLTLVYEKNQNIKKRSALQASNSIVSDVNKVKAVLTDASVKISKTPTLKDNRQSLCLLFNMIINTIQGKYKNIQPEKIIYSLSYILYFLNPTELFIENKDKLTALDCMNELLYIMNNDINNYKQFIEQKENTVFAGD